MHINWNVNEMLIVNLLITIFYEYFKIKFRERFNLECSLGNEKQMWNKNVSVVTEAKLS